jgi:hypothetical protein
MGTRKQFSAYSVQLGNFARRLGFFWLAGPFSSFVDPVIDGGNKILWKTVKELLNNLRDKRKEGVCMLASLIEQSFGFRCAGNEGHQRFDKNRTGSSKWQKQGLCGTVIKNLFSQLQWVTVYNVHQITRCDQTSAIHCFYEIWFSTVINVFCRNLRCVPASCKQTKAWITLFLLQ